MKLLALFDYDAGAELYVYPADLSLADWATYRVPMIEGSGDDAGRYTASVEPNISTTWKCFVGDAQPVWADAVPGVGWELGLFGEPATSQTVFLFGYAAAATLYVYPADLSLADWATNRVLMIEGSGADAGRYSASVDPSLSIVWKCFAGASQPVWADALDGVGWDLGLAGEPVTISLPTTADPADVPLGDDFDAVIAAVTASTSRLVVSLRRCVNSSTADVELDNQTGLLLVSGVDAPTAAAGVVTWAADAVTVHIDADAFKSLRPAAYKLTLEEITLAGRRLLKHSRILLLCRSAGGIRG
jgi:hypothetical protein